MSSARAIRSHALPGVLALVALAVAALPAAGRYVETIPIWTGASASAVPGGQSFTVTVEVASVPAQGGWIRVDTTHRSVLSSPSGSWPHSHYFAPGSSRFATITVGTTSVSSSTAVQIGAADQGVDTSDPNNWSCGTAVTVQPQ